MSFMKPGVFYLQKMTNFMKMRTFYKKLPLFIKKSILHTYKKTQTSNMSFIKNSIFGTFRGPWYTINSAQKINKLSETPVTVHNIAKLCVIDGKDREITKKLVQPVPPHPCWKQWEFQWENDQKNKMAKTHFSGVQNGSQSV